jgi:hypothetical protein
MHRIELAKSKKRSNTIALMGDSRLREGFSARIFDQLAGRNSPRALNLGLSGSDPRVWYYFLKDVDPNCDSFKMIVIGLPSYFDEDYTGTCDKRDDLQLLLPILGLSDEIEFAQSFEDPCAQVDVLSALTLKMYGFRQDLKDLLTNPLQRFQDCKYFEEHWQEKDYRYTGNSESLAGAHIVNNQIVGFPASITPAHRMRLQMTMLGLSETKPKSQPSYLRDWLARLTARYATSSTKLVFVRIPAYPFAAPVKRLVHAEAMAKISQLPNVIINPADAFSSLEKPEYFCDDVHLNSTGRKIFSARLSSTLLKYAQSDSASVAAEDRAASL